MKTSRIATRPRDERDFCLLLFLLAKTSFFFFCVVVVVKVGDDGDGGGGGVFRHVYIYISSSSLKAVMVTFCVVCARLFLFVFLLWQREKRTKKKNFWEEAQKKMPKKKTYTLKTLNIREAKRKKKLVGV